MEFELVRARLTKNAAIAHHKLKIPVPVLIPVPTAISNSVFLQISY